jgi:hypothetical protein
VLKALYCSAPGVPVVGLLQARRERKRGFQVPGVVVEDIAGELRAGAWCDLSRVGFCRSWRVYCIPVCRPLRQGGSSSFYRPRKERITCAPRYLAMWGGVMYYAVE